MNSPNNHEIMNSTVTVGANALKLNQDLEKQNVPIEKNNSDVQNNALNEIPLDSLGYIENNDIGLDNKNLDQTDLPLTVSNDSDSKDETMPELFFEEPVNETFNQEQEKN